MAFKVVILFTAMALLGNTPQVNAAPPDAIFLCDKIPEVCSNMCWATRCATPKFPTILTYDNPIPTVERARRSSAGCGNRNKCTTHGKGVGRRQPQKTYDTCDEYPFAKTSQSKYPNGKQVFRCVPKKQNSSQGGTFGGAVARLKKTKKVPFNVRIGFGNPGSKGAKWCNNQACKNDGFQVQDSKIQKREEEPMFRYFKTSSGMVLATLYDIEPMTNITREADDAPDGARLASRASLDTWTEDVELEDDIAVTMTFMSDIVLGEMTSEETAEYLASVDQGEDEADSEGEWGGEMGWDDEEEEHEEESHAAEAGKI
ncbi:hypothetical protein ACHAQA_008231 [Verticillium albo-atrum]